VCRPTFTPASLEALLSFAVFAVSLIGLICLHPVALGCFVMSDNAAGRRSQNPWCPAKCPATPPTAAPLRQPFASADVTVAKANKMAAHPIRAFISASKRLSLDDNSCGGLSFHDVVLTSTRIAELLMILGR
jgi:hypothetical protein